LDIILLIFIKIDTSDSVIRWLERMANGTPEGENGLKSLKNELKSLTNKRKSSKNGEDIKFPFHKNQIKKTRSRAIH